MDAIPAVPPYGKLDAAAVQCIASSSAKFQVPELLIHSIINKENGTKGQCVRNKNNTLDCGLAQINSTWFDYFKKYGVTPAHVTHNNCVNIELSAYILKDNYHKKGDWFKAIMAYNIGPYRWDDKNRQKIGLAYATDVVNRWWGFQKWSETLAHQGLIPKLNAQSATKRPLTFEADS